MSLIKQCLVLGCLALVGCGASSPIKRQDVSSNEISSAISIEKMAHAAFASWDESSQVVDLALAYALYKSLYHQRPDDINIQREYYNASIILTALDAGPSEQENLDLYRSLHPYVQEIVASPGRVAYIRAENNKATNESLIQLIQVAIKQNPNDAWAWNEYSKLMGKEEQFWFAAALSSQAFKLNSQADRYAFQVAEAMDEILQRKECLFEELEISKKTTQYLNKAMALQPEKELYVDNLALQYLRLGILPIAYNQAKKAYEIKPNKWNADHYAVSALLLNKLDEAETASTLAYTELKDSTAKLTAARIAAGKGDWDSAYQLYQSFKQSKALGFYESIAEQWLYNINTSQNSYDLSQITPYNAWTKTIKYYLENDSARADLLTEKASNRCEMAEAHFYTAMRFWHQDNESKTKEHLNRTIAQRTTTYLEYSWAHVMLKTLF